MNWPAVAMSAIVGGLGGGLTALLVELIPGLRGRKDLKRLVTLVGTILAATAGVRLLVPELARYTGNSVPKVAMPKMTPSEMAELDAAIRAQGIKSAPEAQAFGARLATAGVPLLDDDRLVRRRLLLTRMLSPDDEHGCAALMRGDLNALGAGLGRLTSSEQEAWGELSKEAALLGIRNAPARAADRGLEAMVKVYVAGSTPEDQRRFGAIYLHPELASDAELCWLGRFLGTRAAQAPRNAVASVERALIAPR